MLCCTLSTMLCCTLSTMLCCTLSKTIVNNHCSQLFTFNNHCSIIVDNHPQACFINYCQLLFQQHCNNYCSLSTSNNYRSNNTRQHCEFNMCCWTLITTLFRRCSANNVASTWSIFARVQVDLFKVSLSERGRGGEEDLLNLTGSQSYYKLRRKSKIGWSQWQSISLTSISSYIEIVNIWKQLNKAANSPPPYPKYISDADWLIYHWLISGSANLARHKFEKFLFLRVVHGNEIRTLRKSRLQAVA